MELQEYIPLAPLTTLQIGGPARFFVEAGTIGEVREAAGFARARDLPLFVLAEEAICWWPMPDGPGWC